MKPVTNQYVKQCPHQDDHQKDHNQIDDRELASFLRVSHVQLPEKEPEPVARSVLMDDLVDSIVTRIYKNLEIKRPDGYDFDGFSVKIISISAIKLDARFLIIFALFLG